MDQVSVPISAIHGEKPPSVPRHECVFRDVVYTVRQLAAPCWPKPIPCRGGRAGIAAGCFSYPSGLGAERGSKRINAIDSAGYRKTSTAHYTCRKARMQDSSFVFKKVWRRYLLRVGSDVTGLTIGDSCWVGCLSTAGLRALDVISTLPLQARCAGRAWTDGAGRAWTDVKG